MHDDDSTEHCKLEWKRCQYEFLVLSVTFTQAIKWKVNKSEMKNKTKRKKKAWLLCLCWCLLIGEKKYLVTVSWGEMRDVWSGCKERRITSLVDRKENKLSQWDRKSKFALVRLTASRWGEWRVICYYLPLRLSTFQLVQCIVSTVNMLMGEGWWRLSRQANEIIAWLMCVSERRGERRDERWEKKCQL